MKCIIPCAGESSRMRYIPKHLVLIHDKPLLMQVVDMWKDEVDAFVFVLKRSATYLWEYLPKNSVIVFQDEPRGLADAILQAEKCVDDKFIVALGDCIQRGRFIGTNASLGIGVWKTYDLEELNKSYLVHIRDKVIYRVTEKPNIISAPNSMNCGMGTYFLDPRVFDYIRNSKVTPGGGDFTQILQNMLDAGEKISPVWFEGNYINITHPGDLEKARQLF